MVVGSTRVSGCFSNASADQRLIVELETHTVCWSALLVVNVVVIWARVFVALREVVPH